MPRKKSVAESMEEIDGKIKLLCDQSYNHMKVHGYDKALRGYNKVCDKYLFSTKCLIASF